MQERDRTVLLPGDHTDSGLEVTERGTLRISNAQISSSYVCLATNIVGSAMTRTNVVVVASKAEAEQMHLINNRRKNNELRLSGGLETDNNGVKASGQLGSLHRYPAIEMLQVYGISSTSIKVAWRLATDKETSQQGTYSQLEYHMISCVRMLVINFYEGNLDIQNLFSFSSGRWFLYTLSPKSWTTSWLHINYSFACSSNKVR